MEVSAIILAVRQTMDECYQNEGHLVNAYGGSVLSAQSDYYADSSVSDVVLMDELIKEKIADALRWLCLSGPIDQLCGGSGSTYDIDVVSETDNATVDSNGRITLDRNFLRLIRVRGSSWSRAVYGDSVIREDSAEYLQLSDTTAQATNDRPQAAIIHKKTKLLEVRPFASNTFEVTQLVMPVISSLGANTTVNIPAMLRTSFIYYLTYLVLSTYGDERSGRMLEIAIQNLGRSGDAQRI